MIGGNFGLAAHGSDILIDNNDFEEHVAASWSADILSGELPVQRDITITNNLFLRSRHGINIGGSAASNSRENYVISGNLFYQPLNVGVHTYTTTIHGRAANNILYQKFAGQKLFDRPSALVMSANSSTAIAPSVQRLNQTGVGAAGTFP